MNLISDGQGDGRKIITTGAPSSMGEYSIFSTGDAGTNAYLSELQQQCLFARLAWADLAAAIDAFGSPPSKDDVGMKAMFEAINESTARIWYSLHGVLAAGARISQLLYPGDALRRERGRRLRAALGGDDVIPDTLHYRHRILRDHFEHPDQRLDAWAEQSESGAITRRGINVRSEGMGPRDDFDRFDIGRMTVEFWQDELNVADLMKAVEQLETLLPR